MKTITTIILLAFAVAKVTHADPAEWIGKTIPKIDLRTEVSYTNAIIKEVTADGIVIDQAGEEIWISRYALREEAAKAMGFADAGIERIEQGLFRVLKVRQDGSMVVKRHYREANSSNTGSFAKLMTQVFETTPEPAHDGDVTYLLIGKTSFAIADREIFQASFVTTQEVKDVPTVDGNTTALRVVHLLKSSK